jgi:hypothetical protein
MHLSDEACAPDREQPLRVPGPIAIARHASAVQCVFIK